MQRPKAKIFGPKLALDDFLDRQLVFLGNRRHAGFNAMHARFGQQFGDANLIFLAEGHAALAARRRAR